MSQRFLLILGILILTIVGYFIFFKKNLLLINNNSVVKQQKFNQSSMTITSSAFKNTQLIPYQYTCDGKNVNPPLSFNLVPDKTKSLVLQVSSFIIL